MKKIFLIILVVILLVIGVLFLYTNYKNEVEQRLFGKGKDKQAEIQYSCGFATGWLPKS